MKTSDKVTRKPAVVITMYTQHYALLQRNLLYTAITRGRKLAVLGGTQKTIAIAVKRMDSRRRVGGGADYVLARQDKSIHGLLSITAIFDSAYRSLLETQRQRLISYLRDWDGKSPAI